MPVKILMLIYLRESMFTCFCVEFPGIFRNFGITFLVPYNKDFGRITRFLGNDLATVLFAAFCYELRSNNSL